MAVRLRLILGGLAGAILLSGFLHAGAWAGLYMALTGAAGPRVVAELDLSMAPFLPPNPGGGRAKPAAAWTAPVDKTPAPAALVEAPAPAAPVEDEALPCPEPCDATGEGTGGGGSGEGRGLYIPASQAARQPRWIKNFIGSADYPRMARESGKDGRVVLSVLIDETGRVRDARLLEGGYEALNEVALRKVRQAVFSPAHDEQGRAVACQVTLPIRFELR